MLDVLTDGSYWEAVVRISGPLVLAALAAVLCSRAGILYVGVEGVMLIAAFFAIAGVNWTGSITWGCMWGIGAGVAASLLLGALTMGLRMGDIVGGLVLHVGAIGLTGFLVSEWFPAGATIGAQRLDAPWTTPSWAELVFGQNVLIYLAVVLVIAMELFLRSPTGLRLRVSGESLPAARSLGVPLVRLRFTVHAVAGAIAGAAGVVLGLAIFGTFSTTIVNGRGFIALACVMLGAWRPRAVVVAALVFGAADAYAFQSDVAAKDWVQMLPYVLVLLALGLAWGQRRGPAEEGRPIFEESA
jgi:ABC-type uncharacterized transport system permease subunit